MINNDKVLEIINEWDPIGLFPLAPKNEYASYAIEISEFISTNQSVTSYELSLFIDEMFITSFGDAYNSFNTVNSSIISNKILETNKPILGSYQ